MVKLMLFRPSFCANCGEKVERADWGILTSRRFCQVCESEFKGHDLLPRFVVVLGILLGVFGVGSYLNSGTASDARVLRQPAKLIEQCGPHDCFFKSSDEGPRANCCGAGGEYIGASCRLPNAPASRAGPNFGGANLFLRRRNKEGNSLLAASQR